MKKNVLVLLFLSITIGFGQIPAYYSSIDFTLTGLDLKDELSNLITTTHTSPSTYSECWDILKVGDLDPDDASSVLLIYGYNDDDAEVINDRTRDKDDNGGSPGQWNREHVFPKSLGEPDLGTSGPGSDPHNLRASDVQTNGNRSNRMFAEGTGNAGTVGSNWYPGDEWRGDVARIIMYMYLRYESRCMPNAVAVGSTNDIDANMIDLLLDWNAIDPVSTLEKNRNNVIEDNIGNRNPFIDNPRIANRIWGGAIAEDTWGTLSVFDYGISTPFLVYPVPSYNSTITISLNSNYETEKVVIYSLAGNSVYEFTPTEPVNTIELGTLPKGVYFIQTIGEENNHTQRIVLK